MIFEHMDRIVFAGDSVTDMESAQPVGKVYLKMSERATFELSRTCSQHSTRRYISA